MARHLGRKPTTTNHVDSNAQIFFVLQQVPTLADSGFPDLLELLPYADAVVLNEDLLQRPEGTLRALCARLKLPFERGMLAWPKGGRVEDGSSSSLSSFVA